MILRLAAGRLRYADAQLLRSLRIVETRRRHITLLDPDALRRRAG
jgi:hypothetical protein